jgi:hypothetical protein
MNSNRIAQPLSPKTVCEPSVEVFQKLLWQLFFVVVGTNAEVIGLRGNWRDAKNASEQIFDDKTHCEMAVPASQRAF